MEGLIITTPEQLKTYIDDAVESVFSRLIPQQTAPAAPPQNEYITRKEAAEKLHISLNTLDTYSQEGKLKAYRIGNRVLYKAHEIDGALQAMQTTTINA